MGNRKWNIGSPLFECDATCSDHKVWPWNGHRLFAYDLIRFLRPQLVVELGTYWGTSFFSICQAVKDEQLDCECVAVDTWEGDDHTGPYSSSEVYKSVEQTLLNYYPKVKTQLRRGFFSEALSDFDDGSIDLIHIDGCHDYESVKEDFESWLPKLKENGVMLLHDIADDCGYGSVQYWKELCRLYKNFSFQHSWGLGVLFPKGEQPYQELLGNNIEDKLLYYQYISEANLLKLQNKDMERNGEKQHEMIKHQERVISGLESRVEDLQGKIECLHSSLMYKVLKRLRLLPR